MKVKELREILKDFDDDIEVITKKTEIVGNVGFVNSVRKNRYFIGAELPCVLLTDELQRKYKNERGFIYGYNNNRQKKRQARHV